MKTLATGGAFASRYGPWAIVTGASDGIGREMARDLARRGVKLMLVARRGELLRTLAADLHRAYETEAVVMAVDLSSADGRRAVIDASGALDVGLLVAAAGFGTSGDFVDIALEAERDMLAVNCLAVLELTHHLAPRLLSRGRGGIVLLSSLLAFQGAARSAHYAATKAWVQTLSEGLRIELAPHGVDVVASAPGPVSSGFAARAGMVMTSTTPAEVVARQTLDALGRRGTVRPGWLSKQLGWSLATLPRLGRAAVLSRVMARMTSYQPGGKGHSARPDGSPR